MRKSPRRKWVYLRLVTLISISHNSRLFLLAPEIGIDLRGFTIHILFLNNAKSQNTTTCWVGKGSVSLTVSLALRYRAEPGRSCSLRNLWGVDLPCGLAGPVPSPSFSALGIAQQCAPGWAVECAKWYEILRAIAVPSKGSLKSQNSRHGLGKFLRSIVLTFVFPPHVMLHPTPAGQRKEVSVSICRVLFPKDLPLV